MARAERGVGHRLERIAQASALVALATESYMSNPAALRDLRAAIMGKKHIIVLLKRGVVFPVHELPPGSDVFVWDTEDQIRELVPSIRFALYRTGVLSSPNERIECLDGPLERDEPQS